MKTADLIDNYASELSLVHLPFRRFGKSQNFAAQVQTIKCFEDNTLIRAQLETPGEGRVLIVDGGGSTRVALLGDMLAEFAIKNGWLGLLINGAIRDSAEVNEMNTLVYALGTSPVKSAKKGWGEVGCTIEIGGTTINTGDWVYADADGVLCCRRDLRQ